MCKPLRMPYDPPVVQKLPGQLFSTCLRGILPWGLLLFLAAGVTAARAQTPGDAVQFDQAAYTAFQTAGGATLTVTRTGDTSQPVTVSYTLQDGTAVAGVDYDGTPGGVAFAAGDTSRTLTIPVTLHAGEAAAHPAPGFTVTLSTPAAPWTLGATSRAVVAITNNDAFASAFPLPVTTSGASTGWQVVGGTIHGSTAGAGLEIYEPVHGQPAATASVWYLFPGSARQTPVSLTCAQGYVQVYSGASLAGRLTPVAPTFRDAAAGVWRCTFNNPIDLPLRVCVSNPGTAAGAFDLNWAEGSMVSTSVSSTVNEGASLQVAFQRLGDISAATTLVVTPVGYTHPNSYGGSCAAVPGVDFDATPQTIVFPAGGPAYQTIRIPTYIHKVHEVRRTLTVTIACVQGNAMINPALPPRAFYIRNSVPFTPRAAHFQSVITFPPTLLPSAPAFVTATVSTAKPHGVVTGRLYMDHTSYPFSAAFDSSGNAGVSLDHNSLLLSLNSSEGGQRLLFSVQRGTDIVNFGSGDAEAPPQGYSAARPAPFAGRYTSVMGATYSGEVWYGAGEATVQVGASGGLTMAGTLMDGSAFTLASTLSPVPGTTSGASHAPFHLLQYAPGPHSGVVGGFSGDLQFNSTPVNHQDLSGTATLVSPFDDSITPLVFNGQRYTAPRPGVRALPGLPEDGAFTFSLTTSGFTHFSGTAYWGADNRVNTLSFVNPRVFLGVNTSTGLVTGSVLQINDSGAVPRVQSSALRAVILQGSGELQGLVPGAGGGLIEGK